MRKIIASSFALFALTIGAACGSDFEENGAQPGSSSGFAGGDGGSSGSNDAACVTTSKKAEKQPVDMIIGLDTSFSMDFDLKWTNTRAALKAFVSNQAYSDLGLGLQFFPIRKQCSVDEYEKPAVPLMLQAQAAAPIAAALDAQQMAGGTPMVPLLEGLVKYLRANARLGRKPVIVLATDGVPDDTCLSSDPATKSNTLENAIAMAQEGLGGTPSISTFVIGVGSELTALDKIAAAGGTTKATLVDTGANAQQAIVDALDTIRKNAIPCDFDVPPGGIDAANTNVTYTSGSGATKQLVYVGDANGCAQAPSEGWYFDDEKNPTKVFLCSAACDAARVDDLGRIDLVFGCPRVGVR